MFKSFLPFNQSFFFFSQDVVFLQLTEINRENFDNFNDQKVFLLSYDFTNLFKLSYLI